MSNTITILEPQSSNNVAIASCCQLLDKVIRSIAGMATVRRFSNGDLASLMGSYRGVKELSNRMREEAGSARPRKKEESAAARRKEEARTSRGRQEAAMNGAHNTWGGDRDQVDRERERRRSSRQRRDKMVEERERQDRGVGRSGGGDRSCAIPTEHKQESQR